MAVVIRRLAKIHAMLDALSSSDEGDEEQEVSSDEDVDAGFERVHRRPRVGFKRRPRFAQHKGHVRWYGEWGTGFWHQYIDRENVENHPSLRDEFEERFRFPHELFCDFEDEMTTAFVYDICIKTCSYLVTESWSNVRIETEWHHRGFSHRICRLCTRRNCAVT